MAQQADVGVMAQPAEVIGESLPLGDVAVSVSMEVVDALRQHAERVFPAECCGIVLGRRNERQCVFASALAGKNIDAARVGFHFQLDWETLLAGVNYLRQGADRCMAFYHSHPDGTDDPSAEDAVGGWPGVAMFIVPVRARHAWGPKLWVPGA